MRRRSKAAVAERSVLVDTMSRSCGGSFRRYTSSSVARPPGRDVRLRRRWPRLPLAAIVFAAASELLFTCFYHCALASQLCDETYFSCNKSRLADQEPTCSCHQNCSLYDACCEDMQTSDWRRLVLPSDAYECAVYPVFSVSNVGITVNAAAFVFLITKCPSTYGWRSVAKLCTELHRNVGSTAEPASEQWVTDNTTGITYSNMFCALCYGVPAGKMTFWNISSSCITEDSLKTFGLSGCKNYSWCPLSLIDIIPKCFGPYYASCPRGSQQQMQEACVNNPARYVYDYNNLMTYRNYNCSLCAPSYASTDTDLRCEKYTTNHGSPLIVDLQGVLGLDNCPKKLSTFATKKQQEQFAELCPDTVFDTENCSETVNLTDLQSSYGRNSTVEYRIVPNGVRLINNMSYSQCYKCQPKTISNYTLSSENVSQLANNETYFKPLFQVEVDGTMTICSASEHIEQLLNPCSGLPSEVSIVLMSLSLAGLAMYAIAYVMLPSLQNLPGQIVLHQSAAFFAAFLIWLLRTLARDSSDACVVLGVLVHYFFIAAFTWTTVYAVEVVRALGLQAYGTRYTKRRLWYTAIGWLVPVIITVTAIALNWAPSDSVNPRFRPSYGLPQCFIKNPAPHRILFIAPLSLLLLIDVAIYAYIVVRLVVIHGQTRLVRENQHEKLLLAVKLVFALGFTWIFAVLATATENCYIANVFTVLNSLQGVFVFLIFICNARTSELICQKMRGKKTVAAGVDSDPTASGQGTAVSSTSSVTPKRKIVLGVNSFSPVSLSMDVQEHSSEPLRR